MACWPLSHSLGSATGPQGQAAATRLFGLTVSPLLRSPPPPACGALSSRELNRRTKYSFFQLKDQTG